MTISVAQRKAIHLVAQMLRCDTAKKLRHSQSKGSRTSKMEQSRSRVIDRRCARCSRVQDGARPCRSASCTSTATSVFTTVSLSVEHGGAERRGFCRSHLHPPQAAPSCCGSATTRCSACGDAPSHRSKSPQTAKSPVTARSPSPSVASGQCSACGIGRQSGSRPLQRRWLPGTPAQDGKITRVA